MWLTILDRKESSQCAFRKEIMKPTPILYHRSAWAAHLLDSEAGLTHISEIANSRPVSLFGVHE